MGPRDNVKMIMLTIKHVPVSLPIQIFCSDDTATDTTGFLKTSSLILIWYHFKSSDSNRPIIPRTGVNAWRFLANLTSPVSDGCAAVVDGRLWLVGGEAGVS